MRMIPSLGLGLLLAGPSALTAQTDKAAFVTRLGSDTIAVERFARTKDKLEGDLLIRSPRTRLIHYVASLGSDGTVTRFELTSRFPGDPNSPAPGGVATFSGDVVSTQMHLGDSTWTVKAAVHRGAVPAAPSSYALWEQVVRQGLASKQDSVGLELIGLGAPQAQQTYVARRGKDAVTVGYFGFPAAVKVDGRGRLLSWDGANTTVKVKVERVATADIEGLAKRFSEADGAGKALGQLSPRDTVRAEVGKAHLLVDYGRPAKRGRSVFGGIVPWDVVWRTGANAATQLITDVPLKVGGVDVPAGTYTLWTLPSASGAKLIINKQHGQWGTQYDASQDLTRVDLATGRPAAPVEQFTISVEGNADGTGGTLALSWDTTRYSIGFTVP